MKKCLPIRMSPQTRLTNLERHPEFQSGQYIGDEPQSLSKCPRQVKLMDQAMAEAIRLYMPRAIRLYTAHAAMKKQRIRRYSQ
jgi:hypothetical protein